MGKIREIFYEIENIKTKIKLKKKDLPTRYQIVIDNYKHSKKYLFDFFIEYIDWIPEDTLKSLKHVKKNLV